MNKLDKLKKLVDSVNEKAGDNSLFLGTDLVDYPVLETPWPTLNALCKGIPRGRFTTVAGAEHVGKTSLLLQCIAYWQKQDPEFIALWAEAENSLDRAWMERLGVDMERLIILEYTDKTVSMEQLLQKGLDLVEESHAIDVLVVNSIGALIPQAEVEKTLEEGTMLELQRKLGLFFRKTNSIIKPRPEANFKGTAVIMVGHIYNVPTTTGYELEAVKGGNSVKHWAHVRLAMKRGPKSEWPEKVKVRAPDGRILEQHPGWAGRIRLEKTRQNSNEAGEILLHFKLGRGFDSVDSVIFAAIGMDLIKRNGPMWSHSSFPNGKIKGRDAVFEFLHKNPEALAKVSAEVTEAGTLRALLETPVEPQETPEPLAEAI